MAGKLFFSTFRSWTLVSLFEDCEVKILAVVVGIYFFNTIRSWTLVNLLGDCEVNGNCCCSGHAFFEYHPFLETCEFVGGL